MHKDYLEVEAGWERGRMEDWREWYGM